MGEELANARQDGNGLVERSLSDHDRAIVERFAGNRAAAPKSKGQQVLDRLLESRTRLGASAVVLHKTMVSLRGSGLGASRPACPEPPKSYGSFFAALEGLADELERIASDMEGEVNELSARF